MFTFLALLVRVQSSESFYGGVAYPDNPDQDKNDQHHGRMLIERSTDFEKIRICPFAGPNLNLTDTKYQLLIKQEISDAIEFYQNMLSTRRIRRKFTLNRNECGTGFRYPPNIEIDNCDLAIFIYTQNDWWNPAIAQGGPCELDVIANRQPFVGKIIINEPHYFDNQPYIYRYNVLRHEIGHALGFLSYLFQYYEQYDPVTNTYKSYGNSNILQSMQLMGQNYAGLRTPKVLDVARKHYNCSDLPAVPLWDESQDRDAAQIASHLAPQFAWSDIMNPYSTQRVGVFSHLSAAIFEDSGYYQVDYSWAQSLGIHENAGCDLFTAEDQRPNPPNNSTFEDFCEKDQIACDYNYLGYGKCLSTPQSLDQTLGIYSGQYCQDETKIGSTFNYYSPESICAEYNENSFNQSSQSSKAGCFKLDCGVDQYSYTTSSGSIATCKQDSSETSVQINGQSYYIKCRKYQDVCGNRWCYNDCRGKGICNNGTCQCIQGWVGAECHIQCHQNCSRCREDETNYCTSCKGDDKLLDGECLSDCPEGYYSDDNKCAKCNDSCVKCNGPSSNECTECTQVETLFNGQCKSCPDGQVPSNEGICPCPDGQVPSNEGICLCPDGQVPSNEGICPCPDGQAPSNEGICPCPDGQFPSNEGICPCPDGQFPNNVGICPCPDGQVPSNEGICPCPDGQVPSNEGICPCPDGQAPSNEGICPCPDGQVPSNEGICPCPDGQVSNNEGICCKKGQILDDEGNCACPYQNQYLVYYECVCPYKWTFIPQQGCIDCKTVQLPVQASYKSFDKIQLNIYDRLQGLNVDQACTSVLTSESTSDLGQPDCIQLDQNTIEISPQIPYDFQAVDQIEFQDDFIQGLNGANPCFAQKNEFKIPLEGKENLNLPDPTISLTIDSTYNLQKDQFAIIDLSKSKIQGKKFSNCQTIMTLPDEILYFNDCDNQQVELTTPGNGSVDITITNMFQKTATMHFGFKIVNELIQDTQVQVDQNVEMESSETRTIAAQVTLSNTNVKPKFNWDFKTGSNTVSDTSSITTFKNELTLTKPNPGEYIIDLTVEAQGQEIKKQINVLVTESPLYFNFTKKKTSSKNQDLYLDLNGIINQDGAELEYTITCYLDNFELCFQPITGNLSDLGGNFQVLVIKKEDLVLNQEYNFQVTIKSLDGIRSVSDWTAIRIIDQGNLQIQFNPSQDLLNLNPEIENNIIAQVETANPIQVEVNQTEGTPADIITYTDSPQFEIPANSLKFGTKYKFIMTATDIVQQVSSEIGIDIQTAIKPNPTLSFQQGNKDQICMVVNDESEVQIKSYQYGYTLNGLETLSIPIAESSSCIPVPKQAQSILVNVCADLCTLVRVELPKNKKLRRLQEENQKPYDYFVQQGLYSEAKFLWANLICQEWEGLDIEQASLILNDLWDYAQAKNSFENSKSYVVSALICWQNASGENNAQSKEGMALKYLQQAEKLSCSVSENINVNNLKSLIESVRKLYDGIKTQEIRLQAIDYLLQILFCIDKQTSGPSLTVKETIDSFLSSEVISGVTLKTFHQTISTCNFQVNETQQQFNASDIFKFQALVSELQSESECGSVIIDGRIVKISEVQNYNYSKVDNKPFEGEEDTITITCKHNKCSKTLGCTNNQGQCKVVESTDESITIQTSQLGRIIIGPQVEEKPGDITKRVEESEDCEVCLGPVWTLICYIGICLALAVLSVVIKLRSSSKSQIQSNNQAETGENQFSTGKSLKANQKDNVQGDGQEVIQSEQHVDFKNFKTQPLPKTNGESHLLSKVLNSDSIKVRLLSVLLLLTIITLQMTILGVVYIIAEVATQESEQFNTSEALQELSINDLGFVLIAVLVAQPISMILQFLLSRKNNKAQMLGTVAQIVLLLGCVTGVPFMVQEFCCKASALWVVGGILIVPFESLIGLMIYPTICLLVRKCKN